MWNELIPVSCLPPQDTLCSLAAGRRPARHRCDLAGLVSASLTFRALWMAAKLLESPVEHLKEESRHFLFKELFCLQLKCCCSSLLGGRSLLWLCDSATSDWSPWGTITNTLLRQPNNPGSLSAALVLPGKGMGQALLGWSTPCPAATAPGRSLLVLPSGKSPNWTPAQSYFSFPAAQISEPSSRATLQIFCIQAAGKGASLPRAAIRFGGTWGSSLACHCFPTAPWPDPAPIVTTLPGLSSSSSASDRVSL